MACVLCPTAHPSAPGMLTCWRCRDRLRDTLDPDYRGDPELGRPASVPRLFALLSPFPASGGSTDQGRRSPGFVSSVPIDVHHASLRDRRSHGVGELAHAPTVLASWAGMVVVEREVRPPSGPGGRARLGDVARFLLVHLDWCCGRDWITDYAGELRAVQADLRTAVQSTTGDRRPRPIGRCTNLRQCDPDDPEQAESGTPCGAPLYVPRNGDTITCRQCGAYWPRSSWAESFAGELAPAG